MPLQIDLHVHSLASDGTQEPAALIAEAAAQGVDVLGLTDHDTTLGWDEAAQAALHHGIGLVRGIEVSCRYHGISVHMLAYLPSRGESELLATIRAARSTRLERAHLIVERLAEDYPIGWADVQAQAGEGATLGRPHIADALVAAGIVDTRSEAFRNLLAKGSPYHVSLPVESPIEIIRMIREAGGVSVFAHPAAAARGRVVPDAGVREMIEAGLDGLEVDHRDNPPEARKALRARASELGLIITGSSDYHGAGKPNRLAENTTAEPEFERIVERASGSEFIGVPG